MNAGETAPARPRRTQQFRRTARTPALSADQKRRQAAVTDAAWRAFRAGEPMAAFLNADHPGLGGRPLDLAIDGEDGLVAVLAELRARAEAGPGANGAAPAPPGRG